MLIIIKLLIKVYNHGSLEYFSNDPLILHFRIMSKRTDIYNAMAKILIDRGTDGQTNGPINQLTE